MWYCVVYNKKEDTAMEFIKEFYYGNIAPSDQFFVKGSEYERLIKAVVQLKEEFDKILSEQDLIRLENLCECLSRITSITAEENYIYGFRDGARIIMDILLGDNKLLRKGLEED